MFEKLRFRKRDGLGAVSSEEHHKSKEERMLLLRLDFFLLFYGCISYVLAFSYRS